MSAPDAFTDRIQRARAAERVLRELRMEEDARG